MSDNYWEMGHLSKKSDCVFRNNFELASLARKRRESSIDSVSCVHRTTSFDWSFDFFVPAHVLFIRLSSGYMFFR